VDRYKKGKTNLDFTEARDSEWEWHQLGHMQVCTSLQADNHASTSPLSFYRPDALPAVQPTASKHLSLEWKSEGVMGDESGESMELTEEVPLNELGHAELERLVHG